MKQNITVTDELLYRYVAGVLDAQECALVERWVGERKEHAHQLAVVKALFHVTAPDPGYGPADSNEAWQRLEDALTEQKPLQRSFPMPLVYLSGAAVLLIGFFLFGPNFFEKGEQQTGPIPGRQQTIRVTAVAPVREKGITTDRQQPVVPQEPKKRNVGKNSTGGPAPGSEDMLMTKMSSGAICNNTSCPLEICIIQSLSCGDKAQSQAFCSVLEPDEDGRLHYGGTFPGRNCTGYISEVRITRVSTGESITLNENSQVTAQEFFDHLAGTKTGYLNAGMFQADCDNYCMSQPIKLDNRFGNIVLQ